MNTRTEKVQILPIDEKLENHLAYDPTEELNMNIDKDLFYQALKPRERRVLTMLQEGYTTREIADELELSKGSLDRLVRWIRVQAGQ